MTLNISFRIMIIVLQIFQDIILLTDLSYISFELLVGNIIPFFFLLFTLDHEFQLTVIKQNQPPVRQAQQVV